MLKNGLCLFAVEYVSLSCRGEEGERVSENATDRNRWTSLENGNSPGEGRDQANGPSDAEQFK